MKAGRAGTSHCALEEWTEYTIKTRNNRRGQAECRRQAGETMRSKEEGRDCVEPSMMVKDHRSCRPKGTGSFGALRAFLRRTGRRHGTLPLLPRERPFFPIHSRHGRKFLFWPRGGDWWWVGVRVEEDGEGKGAKQLTSPKRPRGAASQRPFLPAGAVNGRCSYPINSRDRFKCGWGGRPLSEPLRRSALAATEAAIQASKNGRERFPFPSTSWSHHFVRSRSSCRRCSDLVVAFCGFSDSLNPRLPSCR